MKAKSFAGIVLYVKDSLKSADFYETLGFTIVDKSETKASVRLNWFWIDLHAQDAEDKPGFKEEATAPGKGTGAYFYLSVDDVDAAHQDLIAAGYQPSSQPRDWPWGNREFVVRDPDGYKLVVFKRKVARTPVD